MVSAVGTLVVLNPVIQLASAIVGRVGRRDYSIRDAILVVGTWDSLQHHMIVVR